jgi:integrase
MGWKATGRPTVRKQRDRWVVRVDGIDTETGKARPRQLGTYPSQRAGRAAAAVAIETGHDRPERGTVAELLDEWVASRTHVSPNQAQQYRWAAKHINVGLGAIALARLERSDVSAWYESLAQGGTLSRRSIQIIRMTLRAAMANAVASGELRRNVVAHVPMPRDVKRLPKRKVTDAWDSDEIERVVAVTRDHRWGGPILLQLMYGLRRSELLALHWSAVDLEAGTVAIVAGLVESDGQLVWSDGKNARSRRRIALDPGMTQTLREHRRRQAAERIRAGEAWEDNDLVVANHTGGPVLPRNYNHTLDTITAAAGVPRLTSHGLRHTAATHMVTNAADLGEVRAAADILGHSPEMLMKTYSHALPESIRTVTNKIGERSTRALKRPTRV